MWLWVSGCFLLAVGFACLPGSARADGGAPNLAYVTGAAGGMSVIDVAQRRVVRSITVSGDPHMALLSPDGSLLYTSQPASDRVLVIQARSGQPQCSATVPGQPSWLALSPQSDVLYVAGPGEAHVYVLGSQSCKLLHTFSTPGPVSSLAISLLGGAFPKHTGLYQFWVATPHSVIAYDTDGTMLEQFPVDGPQGFCIPAAGFALYVSTRHGTVVAIDMMLHKVTAPLVHADTVGTMDYNATNGEIYVPDTLRKQVLVLPPINPGQPLSASKIVQRIVPPGAPTSVAITSDGQLGFIALLDGHVSMLDVPGHQVITTLAVGGQPRFIITGLYPPVPAQPEAQTAPATSSFPWRSLLFILFVALFCAAFIALVSVLVLWWRRRRA